jgi:hypothetical protein
MARICAVRGLFFLPLLLGAGPPVVRSAAPAPDLDALFQRTDGWIGGDGAFSVALSPTRTLWLFNDTWVGKIRNGRRTDATMVNNTVGIQDRAAGQVNFTIKRGSDGKAAALIVPADGHGWFWPQAAAFDHGRLNMFLSQIEKTKDGGAFGFRGIGQWLATVGDVGRLPDSWQVEQVKMPNVIYSKERALGWGATVLRVGDDLYIYGFDEHRGKFLPDRRMVVARVPAKSVGDFASWRYFRDGDWVEDYHNPMRLFDGLATEYSVTKYGDRYLAVYTENGMSPRIVGRLADQPWGPWSSPAVLFECPEPSRDKKIFSYAAKAHPHLSSGREVVVSYCVNSFDFWQVAREADLYWPRFVRIQLGPP